jgi:hypothetical protein
MDTRRLDNPRRAVEAGRITAAAAAALGAGPTWLRDRLPDATAATIAERGL